MVENTEWIEFSGTFATTRSIEAYGGTKFPREFLERLAEDMNLKGIPVSQHHDPSQRLRTRNMRAEVVLRGDGEYGLIGRGEVHPDDEPLMREVPRLSMTLLAPLGGREATSDNAQLTIAANAAWFPDAALTGAESVLSQVVPAEALRMYEYSFDPDANIVVTISSAAWTLIGGNLVWDAVKVLWAGRRVLPGRGSEPTSVTIEVEGDPTVIGTVKTTDRAIAKLAIESLDKAIEGSLASGHSAPSVMWNESEQCWDDTSR